MENPDAFRRYEDLKIRLMESGLDMESYGREKTFLILEFLRAESLSIEELEDIKKQNLVSSFILQCARKLLLSNN